MRRTFMEKEFADLLTNGTPLVDMPALVQHADYHGLKSKIATVALGNCKLTT